MRQRKPLFVVISPSDGDVSAFSYSLLLERESIVHYLRGENRWTASHRRRHLQRLDTPARPDEKDLGQLPDSRRVNTHTKNPSDCGVLMTLGSYARAVAAPPCG